MKPYLPSTSVHNIAILGIGPGSEAIASTHMHMHIIIIINFTKPSYHCIAQTYRKSYYPLCNHQYRQVLLSYCIFIRRKFSPITLPTFIGKIVSPILMITYDIV